MKRGDKALMHVAVALATGTGLGYGYLLYFGEVEDEFGPVQHAWTAPLQTLHVLTVPLFVFGLGLIWHYHIAHKLRSRVPTRKRTGIAVLSQGLPMIASGYALQVCVDPGWRDTWIWVHLVTSVLFSVAFGLHLLARGRAKQG